VSRMNSPVHRPVTEQGRTISRLLDFQVYR
jgi:hypothetical protein